MGSTFEIRDATPENQPAIMGITGPSGSGKTMSSLLLATGIQQIFGGDIGVIDTEGRRAKRYSDRLKYPEIGKFKHLDFQPPFSSDRYRDAIDAMLATSVKTIVVDSMSHEHEGQGGYLEFHESEIDRMLGDDKKNIYRERKKMTFTGWIAPAAARRKLINSFLQKHANFIFCFRAKEKIKPVTGGEPVLLGWQAIAGDEFVYEMIVRALLLPGSMGVPDWSAEAFKHGAAKLDAQDRHIFPEGKALSIEIGRNLAIAVSGAKPAETKRQDTLTQDDFPPELLDKERAMAREAASKGTDQLVRWFRSLDRDLQQVLAGFKDEMKAVAETADKGKGEPI